MQRMQAMSATGLTRTANRRRASFTRRGGAAERLARPLRKLASILQPAHLYRAIAAPSACTACRVSTSAPARRLTSSQASSRCLAMPCLQRAIFA